MNRGRLILRGVQHFRRTHLGLVLGAMVASSILVGSLLVGASVRLSLREQAEQRIGAIDSVLASHDRFFRDQLAAGLSAGGTHCAPVLQLAGIAATGDGSRRVHEVQAFGVDDRFFALGQTDGPPAVERGKVLLNERLAHQLEVELGDWVLLRLELPSAMPRDLALATADEISLALRVQVQGFMTAGQLGNFSLQAHQIPPFNCFLSLAELQDQLELQGRANLLLLDQGEQAAVELADQQLAAQWTLDDGELQVLSHPDREVEILESRRVFVDSVVAEAAAELSQPIAGVLTYFVNEMRIGQQVAPYSIVTGVGVVGAGEPELPVTKLLPADLAEDELVLHSWAAEDLQAKVGDELFIKYYVVGPQRRLQEEESRFRVRAIVDLDGAAVDPQLMPDFPGLRDSENCRDWEPGIPVDLNQIRDQDEEYWDAYRGTPKAWMTLAAAQKLWGNRFGSLTSVRLPREQAAALLDELQDRLTPASLGLFFQDVRSRALAASHTATDFGGLFFGLSLFLIAAALLLTGLLFALGVEQRGAEVGLLLAVGFLPAQIRRLFLTEAVLLSALGTLLGVFAAWGYTAAVLHGLSSIWQDAVGFATLRFFAPPVTLFVAVVSALAMTILAVFLALRKQVARPAVELLGTSASVELPTSRSSRRRSSWLAFVLTLTALAAVLYAGGGASGQAVGTFFGAGSMLLVGLILFSRVLLCRRQEVRRRGKRLASLWSLGLLGAARRPGRSLAIVALLACAEFLVMAVGAQRVGLLQEASDRSAGTGGFALVGRSTLGVLHDLNAEDGREAFALDAAEMEDVSVVALRVRDGEEASCLNLSSAQQPRLLGVNPDELAERRAFTFAAGNSSDSSSPWLLLKEPLADGAVPAIGDAVSLQWALHRSVGDTLTYRDERGQEFPVRLVAAVAGSILQGNLIVAEEAFTAHYPSEAGYRMFLLDAPAARQDEVAASLMRALEDVGLELVPTTVRLAEFQSVQNTYLSIFQILGGLGLLLGSAGLGVVVLRNVLERRSELALLSAVGYRPRQVRLLVVSEHAWLLLLGILSGALAAGVASLPALLDPAVLDPGLLPLWILLAVTTSGVLWVVLASRMALRGPLLNALRSER
jgi:hypothetical protein